MRMIRCLTKQMVEEMEGALEYAISSFECKLCDPELAEVYHSLADTEYDHGMLLKSHAERKMREVKEMGIKVPMFISEDWEDGCERFCKAQREAKEYLAAW